MKRSSGLYGGYTIYTNVIPRNPSGGEREPAFWSPINTYLTGYNQMLFNKYDNKVIKITKTDLIKGIRETSRTDIYLMEPVDKSNVRTAKQELDRLIRNDEVSLIVVSTKK